MTVRTVKRPVLPTRLTHHRLESEAPWSHRATSHFQQEN